MSASSPGIPPQIEHQLLLLDRQLRDNAFIRGIGKFVCGACVVLGGSLMLDHFFDLNGTLRAVLLAIWAIFTFSLLWQGLIQPVVRPMSLATLAALIEKKYPEFRERLTSLVELRGDEIGVIAPGASKLMQELLVRQTVKVFERLDVDHAVETHGSVRTLMTGAAALLFLFVPFGFSPDGYGLLWSRFFVPWGNYAWGAKYELKVWEGDQTIARGGSAEVHVSIVHRQGHQLSDKPTDEALWLTWHDEKGLSDIQRLEWDPKSQQYTSTLAHVMRSLSYQVSTDGARSGTYRVDVSDPPAITRFTLEMEPPAYTGLPARILEGVPGEIRAPEYSRLKILVEFNQPVQSASLSWPAVVESEPSLLNKPDSPQIEASNVPLVLSNDHCSGHVTVSAVASGSFVVRAKNQHGLENDDPARILTVIFDLPPTIQLEGDDDPALVRPDELVEIPVEVRDDYGLMIIELHADGSNEIKHVEVVPAEQSRGAAVQHRFKLDLAPFGLSGGQVVTYRIRAVDNRPHPQEVWSNPRLLMTNTSLRQLPDKELANVEKSLEDELTRLRTDVNQVKAEMAELHRKTEDESLGKQAETDKFEQLEQLRRAQQKLEEQFEQLTHRLAERNMTQNLAQQARQISDEDLKKSQVKIEQTKQLPVRDQLQPLSQAIDHLGNVDRQLAQLEQQLNELNKLEQDLAELSRMAQRAERLADQLDKMDANQAKAESTPLSDAAKPAEPTTQNQAQSSNPDEANPATKQPGKAEAAPSKVAEATAQENQLQQLKEEGRKLGQQLNELYKKHPELLDAARKDQVDQLNALAEQAKNLRDLQSQLAQALDKTAQELPATPQKDQQAFDNAATKPATDAQPTPSKMDPTSNEPTSIKKPVDAEAEAQAPQNSSTGEQSSPSLSEAVKQQDQIAKDAVQQAAKVAEKSGPDSPAAKAADDFAHQAEAAKVQALKDQLPAAAVQAEQAAESAKKTAQQLNPEGQPSSSDGEQAKSLAERQQQAAQAIKKLAQAKAGSGSEKAAPHAATNPPNQKNTDVAQNSDNPHAANDQQSGDTQGMEVKNPANQMPPMSQSDAKTGGPNPENNLNQSPPTPGNQDASNKPSDSQAPANPNANSNSGRKPLENAGAMIQSSEAKNASVAQQQQGALAAQQQDEIAKEATKQALDLAKETGTDSGATKAAAEFARSADAAREQAQSGQLTNAAQRAEQAAQAAQQVAKQLNPSGQSPSTQSQHAQQLADRQRETAEALKKLEDSPQASQGAQMQGQKQLSDGARRLAEKFDQTTNALKSAPLNLPQEADSSEKAKQATQQAQQAMEQSQQANQKSHPDVAAKSAADAVQKLQEAAEAAKQTAPKPSNAIPVSKKVASPVTDAVKKMNTAEQSLSQCQCNKPGGSGSKPSSAAGQSDSKVASEQPTGQNATQPTPGSAKSESAAPQGQQKTGSKDSQSMAKSNQPGQSESDGPQGKVAAAQPGQTGEKSVSEGPSKASTDQGKPQDSDKTDSQFAQTAQQFRSVASLLRQARGEMGERPSEGRQQPSQNGAQSPQNDSNDPSQPGGEGGIVNRGPLTPDIRQLDAELQQQAQQNWGKLPGQLRTEILQGAGKRSHSEYKQRIKSYFDEISKPSN